MYASERPRNRSTISGTVSGQPSEETTSDSMRTPSRSLSTSTPSQSKITNSIGPATRATLGERAAIVLRRAHASEREKPAFRDHRRHRRRRGHDNAEGPPRGRGHDDGVDHQGGGRRPGLGGRQSGARRGEGIRRDDRGGVAAHIESHLLRTREFFAPRAAGWDDRFPDDEPAYADAIDALGIEPGGVVIDLGCGTGRALPLLRRASGPGGCVVGLDATPEMLHAACAKQRDREAG